MIDTSTEITIILLNQFVQFCHMCSDLRRIRFGILIKHLEALRCHPGLMLPKDARRAQGLVTSKAEMTQGVDTHDQCGIKRLSIYILHTFMHQIV